MYLYFMRHGKTVWNAARKMQGQTDIPLNEEGILQAQKACRLLSDVDFTACYTSPLQRAKLTAQTVLKGKDTPIIIEPLLKEISFGIYEGQSLNLAERDPTAPLNRFFHDSLNYIPPKDGESFYELLRRNLQFLNKIMAMDYPEDSKILITSHGAFIRGIVTLSANLSISQFWRRQPLKNCGMTVVKADKNSYSLLKEAVDVLGGEKP